MKREELPKSEDALQRMDEVLRRMLNAPPDPRKPKTRAKKKVKKPAK